MYAAHSNPGGGGGGGWSHSTTQWCMLKQLHASGFGRTVGSIIWTNQTTKGSIRIKSITIDFPFFFATNICPGLFGFVCE